MNCSALLNSFETRLNEAFQIPEGPHRIVYEAARYSLLSGGKRLRPLLVLTTAQCLGGDLDEALPAAIAVEMTHTYSLIHDDLPGMDNDDYRRGKLTLHKVYGEGQAILAGDLLLTLAFQTLATTHLPDAIKIEMISTLAACSGGSGMIGGQSIDLSGPIQNRSDLEQLHRMKTGALIQASVELGAISANALPATRKPLKNFAQQLGLAFQIIDDVIDITQPQAKHGHKISSDAENDKTTFVSLLGIDGSEQAASSILSSALKELDSIPHDLTPLKNLATTLVFRTI